ncbi:hypothetical protein ANANG_G00042910 [Anguilla anguilla]|uniref:Uncharacterized protein n=1 Tax=Anguilla anguilla TaxID=7936 RepID=A0A9D3S7U0_ANGAN|nr:hypothetical protein ANANG_G00042910 [Anguilla anguilla]
MDRWSGKNMNRNALTGTHIVECLVCVPFCFIFHFTLYCLIATVESTLAISTVSSDFRCSSVTCIGAFSNLGSHSQLFMSKAIWEHFKCRGKDFKKTSSHVFFDCVRTYFEPVCMACASHRLWCETNATELNLKRKVNLKCVHSRHYGSVLIFETLCPDEGHSLVLPHPSTVFTECL